MRRNRTPISLSVLVAMAFAAGPTCAADLVGKWYGKTDRDPLIIIDKAGSEYSGSLADIDGTRLRLVGGHVRQEFVHKSLARLKVADGNVRFTILKEISENGDLYMERDQYNLNLSADGIELTGTMTHLVSYESAVMPFAPASSVTLFATSAAAAESSQD